MSTPDKAALEAEVQRQLAIFQRGAVDLIEEQQLIRRLGEALERGRPLRIKFGMDPSSPDLHLGHAVQLFKLRDLQDLGHTIVLIVGDATALVGDPSGRNKLRPQLTREQIEENLETYREQARLILDFERTELRYNSEWFDRLTFPEVVTLCSRMTVARMIERDTFQKRMQAAEPVGIHEFLYPLMQGWDSVQIRCDVEVGGTDQLFNLHVGRSLQEQEGQAPQVLITHPLIDGSDGRKMSKSYGNAIGLTADPIEMFGRIMSIADEPMGTWFTYLTRVPEAEIEELLAGHPMQAKFRLAHEITAFFHGDGGAARGREAFGRAVSGELPEEVPELTWPQGQESLPLAVLLRELQLVKSSGEARRLVAQGGVRVDGEVATDPMLSLEPPPEALLLQLGKRRYARVVRG